MVSEAIVVGRAGSAERAQRVEAVIQDVCARLVSQLQPAPAAIVLTGSFARGEGSLLEEAGRMRVLGDMEFMIVFPLDADRGRLQRELNSAAKHLAEELAAQGIACELEFRAVTEEYFKALRPHIFGYELISRGRTVWGNPQHLASAPKFPMEAIPTWDAWRLLNNRILEQLQWTDVIHGGSMEELREASYHLVKCHLDLGTAVLIFLGRYRDSYAGRAEALRCWLGETEPSERPMFADRLAQTVTVCTVYKLAPAKNSEVLGIPLNADGEALHSAFGKAALEFAGLAQEVWRWAAAHLAGLPSSAQLSDEQLWSRVLRIQSWRERFRGWAKLALMPAVRSQPGFPLRLARLFHRGSPRYLTYQVAAALHFQTPSLIAGGQPDDNLEALELALPVVFREHATERRAWWRLRANVLTGWRLFLRNHWA